MGAFWAPSLWLIPKIPSLRILVLKILIAIVLLFSVTSSTRLLAVPNKLTVRNPWGCTDAIRIDWASAYECQRSLQKTMAGQALAGQAHAASHFLPLFIIRRTAPPGGHPRPRRRTLPRGTHARSQFPFPVVAHSSIAASNEVAPTFKEIAVHPAVDSFASHASQIDLLSEVLPDARADVYINIDEVPRLRSLVTMAVHRSCALASFGGI
jgi:hypothetical protein